jgi:uncharacterized membrane protein
MSLAGPDEQRTRFRRPLGVAVMAYKAILGLSEIVVGCLLAIPTFDPQATFARLSAEELREDPGDRFVALVSRHLPALLRHRGLIAAGLIVFGLAKLVAAAAMWDGHEWGGYLLAATVALLLPFDIRQAVISPTPGHVLLAVANGAALAALVLLLWGWLPGRPRSIRPRGLAMHVGEAELARPPRGVLQRHTGRSGRRGTGGSRPHPPARSDAGSGCSSHSPDGAARSHGLLRREAGGPPPRPVTSKRMIQEAARRVSASRYICSNLRL